MLNTIMRDFRIAKVASKLITLLNVLTKIIFFSVVMIFGAQVAKLCIEEKKNNKKMGINIWNG